MQEKKEDENQIGAKIPTVGELATLANELGAKLRTAKLTCATAESCTGGLIGHLLTENAGSSDYFAGGAIVYSYNAKERVLGVDHDTLMTVGAVSGEVARQMAQGALQLYDVDIAVSVTGVAGPGGGTPDKPVGTVHIHLCAADGVERGERFVWRSDRSGNKLLSAQAALQMIADYLHAKR
jgi:PncC family amidohydrolase